MKALELEKTTPGVRRAAQLARSGVVVLTEKGKPVFAIVDVKDELALEALALGQNAEFMAYLAALSAPGRKRYSAEETEKEFGLKRPPPRRAKRSTSAPATRR